MEKRMLQTKDAFDTVILNTLHQRAEQKGFKFEE
jgi:hypothetical protein